MATISVHSNGSQDYVGLPYNNAVAIVPKGNGTRIIRTENGLNAFSPNSFGQMCNLHSTSFRTPRADRGILVNLSLLAKAFRDKRVMEFSDSKSPDIKTEITFEPVGGKPPVRLRLKTPIAELLKMIDGWRASNNRGLAEFEPDLPRWDDSHLKAKAKALREAGASHYG